MRTPFAAAAVLALASCASAPPSVARPRALVLVEASGGNPETEAFVGRFLSVLSDAGAGGVADARLAGAKLEILRDPSSSEAVRFRSAYPGDAYLGFDLPRCFVAGRASDIRCTATVTLLSPDGKELAKLESAASSSLGASSERDANPEAEASRAAAGKAATRLLRVLTR